MKKFQESEQLVIFLVSNFGMFCFCGSLNGPTVGMGWHVAPRPLTPSATGDLCVPLTCCTFCHALSTASTFCRVRACVHFRMLSCEREMLIRHGHVFSPPGFGLPLASAAATTRGSMRSGRAGASYVGYRPSGKVLACVCVAAW